jgi:hypothetical protein
VGLHPERRLGANLARAFRDDVVTRLKRKNVERYEILDALDVYPERSDTWISRALNHRNDLSWTTAVELAIRVESRGVKLTSSILDDLAEFELGESSAIVLIHTGDSERLARRLAIRMSGQSPAARRRIEKALLAELKPFERFNLTQAGKQIWALMNVRGDDARVQFFRDVHHLRVDGDRTTTLGPIGVLRRLASADGDRGRGRGRAR